jgi:hypothetical protein
MARPEYLVSNCGSRTCSGWIYREVAGKYEMLFAGYMGDASDIHPLATVSNDYRDLSNDDGGAFAIIIKFNGRRYNKAECPDYRPTYNHQGEVLRERLFVVVHARTITMSYESVDKKG